MLGLQHPSILQKAIMCSAYSILQFYITKVLAPCDVLVAGRYVRTVRNNFSLRWVDERINFILLLLVTKLMIIWIIYCKYYEIFFFLLVSTSTTSQLEILLNLEKKLSIVFFLLILFKKVPCNPETVL